jgi:hypothetical protein
MKQVKVSLRLRYFTRLWISLCIILCSFLIPAGGIEADPAGVTVERYYCVWEDVFSTTSTSAVDIQPSAGYYPLKLVLTPPATADYLLLLSFTVTNEAENDATITELYQNGVQIYYRNFTPNTAGDWVTAGYTDVIMLTGGTEYTFQIMVKTSGGAAALIRDTNLILFKVTNYYYAFDDNTYTYSTSTYQDGLSLNIPNPVAGDYLVITSNSLSSNHSSKLIYSNTVRGSVSQAEIVRQFSRANEVRGYLTLRVMAFTGTAEDIKLQYKTQTPNVCNVISQHIVAVKLSDLGINADSRESEAVSDTTSPTYQTKLVQNLSPTRQGDYLIMGFALLNGSSTKKGEEAYVRFEVNGIYQSEQNFRPDDPEDYVPVFVLKKCRLMSGVHTAKMEYRSSNTAITTSIKNARILAVKVNTLQSYSDSGITPLTVYDGTNNVIHIYGYCYQYRWSPAPGAAMPYKVAYYDGGAGHDGIGGANVYTESISSNPNRSISSSLIGYNVPFASYGTWHAVVYRAWEGDAEPAVTYTASDANSVMEIQFTVQQEALINTPPAVNAVALYSADRLTGITAISPQTEYAVKVTVDCPYNLITLSTVRVIIFYDADGIYAASDVPATGNTQTAAIFTCTVGAVPVWTLDSGPLTTWSILSAHCVQPALNATTGDFWFHFKAGKVATATTAADKWHIYAQAGNAGGTGTNYQENRTMNWYGEVMVNTPAVNFGTVTLGTDFSDNTQTGISVTFVCNGSYDQQIKVTSPWTDGSNRVYLNQAGIPGSGEFALKADNTGVLLDALTVSTSYITLGNGTQTAETGNIEYSNTLWLKLGTDMVVSTYNGTIYYGITP